MSFTGDNLSFGQIKNCTSITGQNLKLERIELISSSMSTQLKINAAGGTVEGTSISEIQGGNPLGLLAAKAVVVEKGINFTGNGYIGRLSLKELRAGGKIVMPGAAGEDGIQIIAGVFGASAQVITASRISVLKLSQWLNGRWRHHRSVVSISSAIASSRFQEASGLI